MTVARRYMVRTTGGALVELPPQAFDRAEEGVAPLSEFAGRCVEFVLVVLVQDAGRPMISHIDFPKVYFDHDGYVDASKRARMIRLMLESCRHPTARHRLSREFAWHPDRRVLDQVRTRFDYPASPVASRDLRAIEGRATLQ
jgi:hypothetical protein